MNIGNLVVVPSATESEEVSNGWMDGWMVHWWVQGQEIQQVGT
jgi:hypothetical protein